MADKQFPYGESRALTAARISVAQKRAVQRKDVQHARQLAAQLAGLPSTSDAVDLDLRYATHPAHTLTLSSHTHTHRERDREREREREREGREGKTQTQRGGSKKAK